MKPDLLQKYVALRNALLKEKKQLETRLNEINQVLGTNGPATPAMAESSAGRQPRLKNPMSLNEAVSKVTSVKPLTKKEILEAVDKLGYQFTAKNPMTSLNTLLYMRGNFKNENGRFSLATKGASKPAGAKDSGAAQKATAKRTVSPEIRAKISVSQKARHAKIKKSEGKLLKVA